MGYIIPPSFQNITYGAEEKWRRFQLKMYNLIWVLCHQKLNITWSMWVRTGQLWIYLTYKHFVSISAMSSQFKEILGSATQKSVHNFNPGNIWQVYTLHVMLSLNLGQSMDFIGVFPGKSTFIIQINFGLDRKHWNVKLRKN